MKQVLWISRHRLTAEQADELEGLCGGQMTLHWWQENVEQIEQLRAAVLAADVIAAVLPLHLLAELVAMADTRPVLITQAKRVLVDKGGAEADVVFTHGGWQRIRRLELELERCEQL